MIVVVSGPPCAGKSTYVQQNAAPEDIVVDFDAIAQAIGSPVSHDHSPYHVEVARRARRRIIDSTLGSEPADLTVWIVDTAPSVYALNQYVRAAAHFRVVDPGVDVCLSRALADGRPEWTITEIHRWYATHTAGANS